MSLSFSSEATLFNVEYLRNGTSYRRSYKGILIETYTRPTQRFNFQLSKILNDIERRAATLRQLSFLFAFWSFPFSRYRQARVGQTERQEGCNAKCGVVEEGSHNKIVVSSILQNRTEHCSSTAPAQRRRDTGPLIYTAAPTDDGISTTYNNYASIATHNTLHCLFCFSSHQQQSPAHWLLVKQRQ